MLSHIAFFSNFELFELTFNFTFAFSGVNGKLLAFEVPWDDLFTGQFTRHLISEGYAPHGVITGEGAGAPGMAFSVHPSTETVG